jgi:hypothetical protein
VTERNSSFEHALERHIGAITNRDIDEFAATVAKDVCLVGTDGNLIAGAAAAIAAHRDWFADPTWRFDASDRVTVAAGDGAGWALIRVRYETTDSSHRFVLFLLFTRQPEGDWRLVYDQGTSIIGE